eukprot:TRINITY_DN16501_c0_g3_i1.p1 TRINITY_DN16501_c0_g3~~TRINITY_DN16501_c0_g3_i1.p1  ORF type:complete len:140 (-),score=23.01 TRINITY_DN16501_c0_g3_i1:277-696(-)
MNVDGGCSACGGRPAMCDACFPESACSTAYDPKYPIDFDNYVRPWVWSVDLTTTTQSTSVATSSSATSLSTTSAARSQDPSTAATSAQSTGAIVNSTESTTKRSDGEPESFDGLSGASQVQLSGCMAVLAVLAAVERLR